MRGTVARDHGSGDASDEYFHLNRQIGWVGQDGVGSDVRTQADSPQRHRLLRHGGLRRGVLSAASAKILVVSERWTGTKAVGLEDCAAIGRGNVQSIPGKDSETAAHHREGRGVADDALGRDMHRNASERRVRRHDGVNLRGGDINR